MSVLIPAVVIGGFVLHALDAPDRSVFGQASSLSSPQAPALGYKIPATTYCGATSCAAASCHGGGQRGRVGSEYTTWVERDPHSRAYSVLFNDVSTNIARRLQFVAKSDKVVPAHQNAFCLKCHALDIASPDGAPVDAAALQPESGGGSHAFAVSGVGCENCHGGAGDWLTTHYQPSFLALGVREKAEQHGLNPTKDLAYRISRCASCHVGGPDREVNHDLIAAGHPRLKFEYTSFQARPNYQPHWKEKAFGKDFEARAWAIGQIASAVSAVDLLRVRAERASKRQAPWPEFAEYSCYACHKNLGPDSERWQPLTATDRAAGAIPWGSWTTTLLPALAENDNDRRAVANLNKLRGLMEKNPAKTEGVAALCVETLKDLRPWLERLEQSAEQDSQHHPYSYDALVARFCAIAVNALSPDRNRFNNLDWDAAIQHYLGLAAIDRTLEKDHRFPGLVEPLDRLRRQLTLPPGYNSPRDAKPSEILKLFQTLSAVPLSSEPRP